MIDCLLALMPTLLPSLGAFYCDQAEAESGSSDPPTFNLGASKFPAWEATANKAVVSPQPDRVTVDYFLITKTLLTDDPIKIHDPRTQ